ncbi:hypothetical protein SYYSPA8_32260 [Streptomyces yaizuensis]|uniref:WXG100 family type VII secretion target n=1 Tax=Streptomyces yaizuensis TaxID=2989713 RepID=A0ABQ5P927_9ACTN|nr:hypothetical protein [Streptomyces sp. YSPA8]GLF99071.1 hypothetical protein SYYSPA8_32260 [Streptomyces sp. YSPA8]
MLDAESGGVGGPGGSGDLARGIGALKNFHQQVTTLLAEFEGGEGGSAKVAEQRVARASFSGANLPFAEADGFFQQYQRVHTSLVSLSRSLGRQIEALTIGVHAADVGYDNVEEEMRQRFHSIEAQLKQERDRVTAAERPKLTDDSRVPTDLG